MSEEHVICESCDARVAHEDAIYSEGCYFCPKCHAAWFEEYKACQHEWDKEPYINEWSEEGRICRKCHVWLANEEIADLRQEA